MNTELYKQDAVWCFPKRRERKILESTYILTPLPPNCIKVSSAALDTLGVCYTHNLDRLVSCSVINLYFLIDYYSNWHKFRVLDCKPTYTNLYRLSWIPVEEAIFFFPFRQFLRSRKTAFSWMAIYSYSITQQSMRHFSVLTILFVCPFCSPLSNGMIREKGNHCI